MPNDRTLHVGVSEELYAAIKQRQRELKEREGVDVADAALARSALEQVFLPKTPAKRKAAG